MRSAFTLIELIVAVLLLSLLASAAVMSFSQPLRGARLQDTIDQIRSFDATARRAAVASGRECRLEFDLASKTLSRRDGDGLAVLRSRASLAPSFRISDVRIGIHSTSVGEAVVDVSPMGASRTYALHLIGPATDQWVLFAGLSGDMTLVKDEAMLDEIFGQITARHNTD